MAGKLVIGPEGFVDLRKNPPATTVTVQGFTAEDDGPRKMPVATLPEPPAVKREEVLPGRQKTTEGLETSVAEPVKVKRQRGPIQLERIYASDGHPCYVIVSKNQYARQSRHKWTGTRNGTMYRKVKSYAGEEVVWLHRVLAACNRKDQFVGFRDGDERNLVPKNLLIFNSKAELHAHRQKVRNGQS